LMHMRSCSLNSNVDEQHQRDGNEHDDLRAHSFGIDPPSPTVQHHDSSLAVQ
jgi:hypothetical protein